MKANVGFFLFGLLGGLSLSLHAATVTQIAGGQNHSLFVMSDGSLWSMGLNQDGQLGLGSGVSQTSLPQQVSFANASAVAAGVSHSVILKTDGSLWTVGYDDMGQLGNTNNGANANLFTAVQIVSSNVTAIAAGNYNTFFSTAQNTGTIQNPQTTIKLLGMGDNFYGELGDTTTSDPDVPETLQTFTNSSPAIVRTAGAFEHTLFLKIDGSLWGMGRNEVGQLGDGTTTERTSPVPIDPGPNLAVAAGGYHSMYLKSDGSLWAMGTNSNGQLGDGTTSSRLSPVMITNNVTAVAAGYYHSLFIKSDGSLWAIGYNGQGQLGDGTTTERHLPVQIVPGNVVAVAAGFEHSFFIKSDGSLWAMGWNAQGQLGDGTTNNRHFPVQIIPHVPPPAVTTQPASLITSVSASLNALAVPGNFSTVGWFEWGTTTNFGNVTPMQSLGSGIVTTNFSQGISGLTNGGQYFFRADISNSLGVVLGANQSFTASGTNMIYARARHTATLLQNGRVLVAGGFDQNSNTLAAAELFDPATGTWTATGSMTTARFQHSATLLPSGKVLIAGGQGDGAVNFATAEVYDPVAGTWTPTGSLATNRFGQTATLLANGKVLVAGGVNTSGYVTKAELYDPAAGSWSATGVMATNRYNHTATMLANGKVLVAGGQDATTNAIASSELYDPTTGTWTATGLMNSVRFGQTSTLLPGGKVLAVAGVGAGGGLNITSELYDPTAGTWTLTGGLAHVRFYQTATLLPNGQVFAAAGGSAGPTAEIFNPTANTWSSGGATASRSLATATLLANGKVLLTGGIGSSNFPFSSAQLFDPAINISTGLLAGSTTSTGSLHSPHEFPTLTLITNGTVLIAGGFTNANNTSVATAEVFNPTLGTNGGWTVVGNMTTNRCEHTATLIPNGKVLVTGGLGLSAVIYNSAELFDPGTGLWTATGSMSTNRCNHTATLLPTGKVLVAGGLAGAFNFLSSAELYDPVAGTWTNTGSMNFTHTGHAALLLPTGKVLVVSGTNAELYDPNLGTWTVTASPPANLSDPAAILLNNGTAMMTLSGNAAGIYDPVAGTWSSSGTMTTNRGGSARILLPNGKVLVSGGESFFVPESTAEIYDPLTGVWTLTGSMQISRNQHSMALLPNGLVLIASGNGGPTLADLSSAELFNPGLGFSSSWQPQITTNTATLTTGGTLTAAGTNFRGVAEGSGGNGSQDSAADYPLMQLRALEGGQTLYLPCTNWNTNTFTSAPGGTLPVGWSLMTPFVNGIPGTSVFVLNSAKIPATVTLGNLSQFFDGLSKRVTVTTSPTNLSVTVTYNGSTAAPVDVNSYFVVATISNTNYTGSGTNTLQISARAISRDLGVDVSHFQAATGISQATWNQIYANGQHFAFVKATEGLTGPNDTAVTNNVNRAKAAGLLVGVYHFAHPENRPSPSGGVQEADALLSWAGNFIGPGYLRPVLDMEETSTNLSAWAIAFANEIVSKRGVGATPIIYCTEDFANVGFDSSVANYDLWLRATSGIDPAFVNPPPQGYAVATGVFNNWSFWQYTEASSGGIDPLDFNICHNEYKTLASFLIPSTPTPIIVSVSGATSVSGGAFSLAFTNTPGIGFSILTSSNLSQPMTNWTVLGTATEPSPGQFQFTDTTSTNDPRRYYRIRSP